MWVNITIVMLSERSWTKKSMFSIFPLRARKCKPIYSDRKWISVCLGTGVEEGLDRGIIEGYKETSECVQVYYLDCGDGFKGVYRIMDIYVKTYQSI